VTVKNRIAAMMMITLCVGMLVACEPNETSSTNTRANETTDRPEKTSVSDETTEPLEQDDQEGTFTVRAKELRVPWVIAFDENIVYISEREGNVVKVDGDWPGQAALCNDRRCAAAGAGTRSRQPCGKNPTNDVRWQST